MARMLGQSAWDGPPCHCCHTPRTRHHQRAARERQALQRWVDEYEDPPEVEQRACPNGGVDCECRHYTDDELNWLGE